MLQIYISFKYSSHSETGIVAQPAKNLIHLEIQYLNIEPCALRTEGSHPLFACFSMPKI